MTTMTVAKDAPAPPIAAIVEGLACGGGPWTFADADDHTGRAYQLVLVAEHYEVWAIRWSPGARLAMHDHGEAAAAVTVVSGALEESVLGQGDRRLTPGPVFELPVGHVHRVENVGAGPAVSLHAYAPRLRQMTFYGEPRAPIDR
jgi:quercetin dioxygenase-like cupin family protein